MYSRKTYSRSPGPSKSPLSPTQTPTFQPPSFYAAAANIPYPSNTPLPYRREEYKSPNIAITYPTQTMVNGNEYGGDMDPTRNHHDQSLQGPRKRASSISRSLARAIPRSGRPEREEGTNTNRKSQLNDIPLLETQLLPSLRDTIDRMTHPHLPADVANNEPHRPSRNRSTRALTQETIRSQSSLPPPFHYTESPSTLTSPPVAYEGTDAFSLDIHSRTSPRITIEGPTPDKDCRPPARSAKFPVRSSSPRNVEVEASPSVRLPRVQDTNDVRSRIPHAKPARSNPGTPKSALRTPLTLATPRITRSPHSPALSRMVSSPRSPLSSSSELEREYERTMAGVSLKAPKTSPPSTSSDSGESEREREQWRQRNNAWGRSRRLKDSLEDQKPTAEPDLPGPSRIPSRHRSSSRTRQQRVGLGLQVNDQGETRGRNFGASRGDENKRMETQVNTTTHEPGSREHQVYQRKKLTFREDLRRREALLCAADESLAEPRYQVSPLNPTRNGDVNQRNRSAVADSSSRRPAENGSASHREKQEWAEDSSTDTTVEADTRSRRRKSGEISRSSNNDQHGRNPHGQQENTGNHPSWQRNRRSSSVPATAHPSNLSNSLLGQPRPEKSVRFQQADEDAYVSEEELGRMRSRRRANTGNDVPEVSRRASNSSDRTFGHQTVAESYQQQGPVADYRRSKDFNSCRERAAFGIPHSLSYTGKDDGNSSSSIREDSNLDTHTYDVRNDHLFEMHLPHAESDLSSVDGGSWQSGVGPNGFSRGAESLFKSLSVNGPSENARQHRRRSRGGRRSPAEHEFSTNAPLEYTKDQVDRLAPRLSETFSTPSVYDDDESLDQIELHSPSSNEEASALQSVMHPRVYNDLFTRHGRMEMRRQDVIFELSSSEAAFVRCLRSMVRRFILPLRQKDSKAWVDGVPESVSRLFDWLEDIVNLHVGLGEALVACGDLWKAGDIVNKVAETIRAFVPRFEVYQPYLMRVDHVRELLTEAVNNPEDQLGQFLQIREQESTRDGRSIIELLQEPARRLDTYSEFFRKLLEFTPRTHTDYLASLSLLHSTRMTIQVLYEVRAREKEYEHAKGVLAHVVGLSPSIVAQRERRLLWEGVVKMESSFSQETRRIVRQGEPTSQIGSSETTKVKLVVFTDMIVLASLQTRSKRSARGNPDSWRVLESVGVSRVLRLDEKAHSISLDLLPLNPDDVQSGIISETSSSQSLDLAIPSSWSAEERGKALTALRKCHTYAIRSLSFPSYSGKYLSHGLQVDLEQDTKQSVMAIISTGLPLPKSPSVQIADLRKGHGNDSAEQEREERGWWSLRFQQIMRELQRQNIDQIMESQSFLVLN